MFGYAHELYFFFKDCSRRMGKKNEKTGKHGGGQMKWLPWQIQISEEGRERKVI